MKRLDFMNGRFTIPKITIGPDIVGKSETEVKKEPATEEWIWVEGYKGTKADMTCNDYQFELGKQHDMPEDSDIECYSSGFHFCTKLKDVYGHYDIEDGNRFFKVRALVRKADYDDLEKRSAKYNKAVKTGNWLEACTLPLRDTKLTSKSIEFISELTTDEILDACGTDTSDWTAEEKELAIKHGRKYVPEQRKKAEKVVKARQLVQLGYSGPFAEYLTSIDKFDVAYAVGSQTDMSMDMKVLMILRGDEDKDDA